RCPTGLSPGKLPHQQALGGKGLLGRKYLFCAGVRDRGNSEGIAGDFDIQRSGKKFVHKRLSVEQRDTQSEAATDGLCQKAAPNKIRTLDQDVAVKPFC